MNQYLYSYLDICSGSINKKELINYNLDYFARMMVEGAKWKLGEWLGHDRVITMQEWQTLKAHDFPFRDPNNPTSIVVGILSSVAWGATDTMCPSTKIIDLDSLPLVEYMGKYADGWNHANTEKQRIDIFNYVKRDLWDRISDSIRYVWGG